MKKSFGQMSHINVRSLGVEGCIRFRWMLRRRSDGNDFLQFWHVQVWQFSIAVLSRFKGLLDVVILESIFESDLTIHMFLTGLLKIRNKQLSNLTQITECRTY